MDTATAGAGNDLPPFRFAGVRSQVFPLRAHGHALQRLCDTYLNRFPEELCFRPAAPYVVLAVLHYGRMSYAPAPAMHRGWASQNEVYFGVPLEWGRLESGRWRAQGWGMVAPFLFVDQPWSLEQGRDVYGWPKQPAELGFGRDAWSSDGRGDRERVVNLGAESFARPYAGERPSRVSLVDIDRVPPPGSAASAWRTPLGLDAWRGAASLWREAIRLWSSPGHARNLPVIWAPGWGTASRAWCNVNLKQVRSLEDPAIASYQAITMSPMRMTALHGHGLLGEGRIVLGDPTGGYRVRVRRHPLFPIVETLGLVPDDDHGDRDADREVTLAPLFPQWLEADLEYGRGTTALWRSPHVQGGAWHRRAAEPGAQVRDSGASPARDAARFDPTWGARMLPAPPYHYPQLVMRVLALPATRDLARVVAGWQPPPEVGRFRLLAPEQPSVLMMVSTCRAIAAQINSVGSWWQRSVSFLVPVIWTRNDRDTVALVCAITFADGLLAATIAREIGPEVVAADLAAPPDAWLDDAGPRADRKLLSLTTQALDARDADVHATQRLLLEVLAHGQPVGETAESTPLPDGDLPLCIVGRRRVGDATDPEAIAHDEWFTQNLVSPGRGARALWRSTTALEVRIHHYPDRLDLVGRLALDGDRRTGSGIVHAIPARLAWAMLDLTHESNTSLAVRSHGGPWTAPARPPGSPPREPALDDALARALVALAIDPGRCGHG